MDVLPPWRPEATPSTPALTPHQREIALLVGDGLTNREIAARLGTTPGWVGTQVGRIVQRRGLTCRADIAAQTTEYDLCRSGRWRRVI
jgi:DNA-binding NarL/FixJ family response regulator